MQSHQEIAEKRSLSPDRKNKRREVVKEAVDRERHDGDGNQASPGEEVEDDQAIVAAVIGQGDAHDSSAFSSSSYEEEEMPVVKRHHASRAGALTRSDVSKVAQGMSRGRGWASTESPISEINRINAELFGVDDCSILSTANLDVVGDRRGLLARGAGIGPLKGIRGESSRGIQMQEEEDDQQWPSTTSNQPIILDLGMLPPPSNAPLVASGLMHMQVMIRVVSSCKLLESLTRDELDELARYSILRRYAYAAPIVKQGQASLSMFVIVEGEIDVYHGATWVFRGGVGHVVDEDGLVLRGHRAATVTAACECTLGEVTNDCLSYVLRRRPKAYAKIVADARARARTAGGSLDELKPGLGGGGGGERVDSREKSGRTAADVRSDGARARWVSDALKSTLWTSPVQEEGMSLEHHRGKDKVDVGGNAVGDAFTDTFSHSAAKDHLDQSTVVLPGAESHDEKQCEPAGEEGTVLEGSTIGQAKASIDKQGEIESSNRNMKVGSIGGGRGEHVDGERTVYERRRSGGRIREHNHSVSPANSPSYRQRVRSAGGRDRMEGEGEGRILTGSPSGGRRRVSSGGGYGRQGSMFVEEELEDVAEVENDDDDDDDDDKIPSKYILEVDSGSGTRGREQQVHHGLSPEIARSRRVKSPDPAPWLEGDGGDEDARLNESLSRNHSNKPSGIPTSGSPVAVRRKSASPQSPSKQGRSASPEQSPIEAVDSPVGGAISSTTGISRRQLFSAGGERSSSTKHVLGVNYPPPPPPHS